MKIDWVFRALVFASQKHAGQLRKGGNIPYINHPIEVAQRVATVSGSASAVCAAFLHDVLEDTDATPTDILALYPDNPEFGEDVLHIVEELTDPRGLPYPEIKTRETRLMQEGKYSYAARLVKVADQTCNMIDLVRTPPGWGKGEEQEYIEQMRVLVDAARGTSHALEQQFDAAYAAAKAFYGMS